MKFCYRNIHSLSKQLFGDSAYLTDALKDANSDESLQNQWPLLLDLSDARAAAEKIRVRTVQSKPEEIITVYTWERKTE